MVSIDLEINIARDLWLSDMLQRHVGQLGLGQVPDGILPLAFEQSLTEFDFAYSKVPVMWLSTIHALESQGFHLVDTQVTLRKPLQSVPMESPAHIRFAHSQDEAQVATLAERSFQFSRFHLDPDIPNTLANTVKKQWARNYFQGQRGQHMVVATSNDHIVGFLQLLDAHPRLVIDLIAVAPEQRRTGTAARMIAFAEANIKGFTELHVGTQLANIPSIQLYEKLGFGFMAAQYVLHYHRRA